MIAHVAEAGERKGRVVVHVCTNRPSPIAFEAAVRIAQAYNSEVEGLFVEDPNLLELANFPFAREISLGGKGRALSADLVAREMRQAFLGLNRQLELLAGAASVPIKRRIVRDDPIRALQAACAECGPWNLITLADPFSRASCGALSQVFKVVTDTTGLVIVGPAAKRSGGRVVIMSDAGDNLPGLIQAAQRIAAVDQAQIVLSLVSDDDKSLAELEDNARLLLADYEDVEIHGATLTRGPDAASEVLRRQRPGFVITRFGGLLVPSEGNLRSLAQALECPLLLIR